MRIALFLVVVISYGSLYPFAFDFNIQAPLFLPLLQAPVWSGILDCVANILLFLPLAMWLRGRQHGSTQRVLFFSVLFALDLQLLQVYLPARDPALMDVFWNGVGAILGLALVRISILRQQIQSVKISVPRHNSAVLLLMLWLVGQLFPYLPDLNWLHWQQNWDRLQAAKLLSLSHVVLQFFIGLVVFELFRAMQWRLRYAALLLFMVLLFRSWLLQVGLDWPRLLAWPLAVLFAAICYRLPASLRWRSLLLGLGLGYIATSLSPLLLRPQALSIEWIPLYWLFNGVSGLQEAASIPVIQSLQQLLQRLFVLACIGYLWRRIGVSYLLSVITVGLFAFTAELAQRNLLWQLPTTDEVSLWLLFSVLWLSLQRRLRVSAARDWSSEVIVTRDALYSKFRAKTVTLINRPLSGNAWNLELGVAISIWLTMSLIVGNLPFVASGSWSQYWLNEPHGGSLGLIFAMLVFFVASIHWFVARQARWPIQLLRALTAALTVSLFALLVAHAALRPTSLIELFGVPALMTLKRAAEMQWGGLLVIDLPAVLLAVWRVTQIFILIFGSFVLAWLAQLLALRLQTSRRNPVLPASAHIG